MLKAPKDFWITNISNRDITLYDIGVPVRARTSINLLDKKHYHISEEDLEKSLKTGDLFKKKKFVIKRMSPPTLNSTSFKIAIDYNAIIPARTNSIYEIKQEKYDELIVTDEQFAEDNVETVEMDKQPPIKGQ